MSKILEVKDVFKKAYNYVNKNDLFYKIFINPFIIALLITIIIMILFIVITKNFESQIDKKEKTKYITKFVGYTYILSLVVVGVYTFVLKKKYEREKNKNNIFGNNDVNTTIAEPNIPDPNAPQQAHQQPKPEQQQQYQPPRLEQYQSQQSEPEFMLNEKYGGSTSNHYDEKNKKLANINTLLDEL